MRESLQQKKMSDVVHQTGNEHFLCDRFVAEPFRKPFAAHRATDRMLPESAHIRPDKFIGRSVLLLLGHHKEQTGDLACVEAQNGFPNPSDLRKSSEEGRIRQPEELA